ncbi:MAG TPA: winged helix-turn-helix domain-containing protein [Vicinamibacteria bacterium]|nr:winged helix-turn-helix domain-containing protein [Vicinamibacteria bacterium]
MGEARPVLRFGVFELDLEARQLRRSGIPVHLTRQAFSVLRLLVSGAGRVITRGELRRALWTDGTHVEFERGINFCINQVRVALRDDARAPRFVETLPRVGYRFVAEVGSFELPPVPLSKVHTARSRHLALAAALALAAVSGAGRKRSIAGARAHPRSRSGLRFASGGAGVPAAAQAGRPVLNPQPAAGATLSL